MITATVRKFQDDRGVYFAVNKRRFYGPCDEVDFNDALRAVCFVVDLVTVEIVPTRPNRPRRTTEPGRQMMDDLT